MGLTRKPHSLRRSLNQPKLSLSNYLNTLKTKTQACSY